MTFRRLAPFAVFPAVLVLVACSGSPDAAPSATRSDPGIGTCDAKLFTDNVPVDLTATAEPISDPAFPIEAIQDTGDPVTCTAHLSVDYESGQTIEFDIALVNAPIKDLAAQLDDITADQGGWVRDKDNTIWRDAEDQNTFIEALEIEEGVLVGVTV